MDGHHDQLQLQQGNCNKNNNDCCSNYNKSNATIYNYNATTSTTTSSSTISATNSKSNSNSLTFVSDSTKSLIALPSSHDHQQSQKQDNTTNNPSVIGGININHHPTHITTATTSSRSSSNKMTQNTSINIEQHRKWRSNSAATTTSLRLIATTSSNTTHNASSSPYYHHHRYFFFFFNFLCPSFTSSRRSLLFEPSRKLYFPYDAAEKQSRSAVRIKNVTTSPVAFKFLTTAPKSCFMRPPSGVLSPGESIVATVFKVIELNNSKAPRKIAATAATRNKFKILSLKMEHGVQFTPNLFEEQKQAVVVEQVLQVILLNPNHPSPQLQALSVLLAEADAAHEAQRKSETQNPDFAIALDDALQEWKQLKGASEIKQPKDIII